MTVGTTVLLTVLPGVGMTTVALTYDQIAERLGISVDSARRHVLRKRWRKSRGNDGRSIVQVPADFLEEHDGRKDGPADSPADAGTDDGTSVVPTVLPTDTMAVLMTDMASRLAAAQDELAEMARQLGAAEGELKAVTVERDRLLDLLRQERERLDQERARNVPRSGLFERIAQALRRA